MLATAASYTLAWPRNWAIDTSAVVAVGEVVLWGEIVFAEEACRGELEYPRNLLLVDNQDAENSNRLPAAARPLRDRW